MHPSVSHSILIHSMQPGHHEDHEDCVFFHPRQVTSVLLLTETHVSPWVEGVPLVRRPSHGQVLATAKELVVKMGKYRA